MSKLDEIRRMREAKYDRARQANPVPKPNVEPVAKKPRAAERVQHAARTIPGVVPGKSEGALDRIAAHRDAMRERMRLRRARESIPKLEKRLTELKAYVKAKEMLE